MKIKNPLQITNWKLRNFLIFVLTFQLGIWGTIVLDFMNLQIPFIRQFIGIIYVIFIPGVLILRILKINYLNSIETLLYSVGLSLTTSMFVGFIINTVSVFIGIHEPISSVPLVLMFSFFIILLCIICYLKDKNSFNVSYINVNEVLSLPFLSLCTIPFFSIFGTYLVNYQHTNTVLMIMIALIAIVALLIAFDRFIPIKLFPFAIWVMSIALVWHYSLITEYAGVHDGEFYFAKLVIEQKFWQWNSYSNYNSILSVTILPPVIHFLCNMDLTWIYKIIYPVILSLIPLGVYDISTKYFDEKNSFLAAYFFLVNSEFFFSLPTITKQLISTFYLMLLFMSMFNKYMNKMNRSILIVIFGVSVIISHYGTSFLVMFSITFVWILSHITNNRLLTTILINLTPKIDKLKNLKNNLICNQKIISSNFLLLFITFTLGWYIYVSSSSAIDSVVHIGSRIIQSILTEFFSPEYSRGAYMLSSEYNGLTNIYKYLKLSFPLLILLGFLTELFTSNKSKFECLYIYFSIYFISLLFASVIIPNFATMSPSRLYILTLPILAPFSIVGRSSLLNIFGNTFRIKEKNKISQLLFVYFTIFLLFSTQFIFVLANEGSGSISIGQESIEKYDNKDDRAMFYSKMIMEYDISSLKWLSKSKVSNKKLYFTGGYTHLGSVLRSQGYFPINNIISDLNSDTKIAKNQYILLIYANIVENIGYKVLPHVMLYDYFNMSELNPVLQDKNIIYTNGYSKILWS